MLWDRLHQPTEVVRQQPSRLIALADATANLTIWAMVNVGGNFAGLGAIALWLDHANGARELNPLLTNPLLFLLLSVAASIGQAALQQLPAARTNLVNFAGALLLMAVDLGLSTLGRYTLAQPLPVDGTPVHTPSLVIALGVAFVGGVICQYRAHYMLRDVVFAAPAAPPARPAAPNTTGRL
jgi:hypothetical protein